MTLNLDFCHSMILGHWSSGFKNQDGEWASQNDSQTMIMSCPACGCGAWLLALPQPSEQSSFNSVLKFETSYEILTQKGFFYKEKKKKGKIPVLSSDWHVYTNALILNSRKFRVTGSRAHLPPGPTNAANDRAGSDHHILFVVLLLLSRYIRPSPRCGRRRPALPAPCSGPAQEPALGNVMVNFVCQFGLM